MKREAQYFDMYIFEYLKFTLDKWKKYTESPGANFTNITFCYYH